MGMAGEDLPMDLQDVDLAPATLLLLWAARETGALDALASDADTPADVAATAGVDGRAADLLVAALEREELLDRVGEAYEPTNRMLGFLAAADLRSVGRLPDALDAVDALLALPETMVTGSPPDAGSLHHRLGARAAVDEATVRAVTTAAVRSAPDAERVLDVRGAPGHYATAFASLGNDVTLVDRPEAVERSRPLLAPTDVELVAVAADDPVPADDRFAADDPVPADDRLAADDPLPDADLVFAGDVTRRLPPDEAGAFVGRLADAAAPEGTVVVADVVWDRSPRAVPAAVTAFARDGGTVHATSDYAAWFEAAGLGTPTTHDVPGTDRQVVVGDRPG
jgi:hypothetical protein